jgi:hypothetical protein
LVPTVRVVGLSRQHFQPQLAAAFGVAIGGDRDRILHMVQNADGEVRRLYRLGVELSHPQTLQLARQIKESVDRERRSQTEAPDTDDDSMDYAVPVLTAVPKAPAREVSASGNEVRANDIVAVPGMGQDGASTEPKASGTAAAVALLRDALAQGPLDVKIIQRRAVDAGLLEENMPISKSKVFRSARAMLGVTSHQKPGRRAAGWIWSLPDQVTADTPSTAHARNLKASRNDGVLEKAFASEAERAARPLATTSSNSRPAATYSPPKVQELTTEQWIIALKIYQQHGAWSAPGNAPGLGGCLVPRDILETHGYGRKKA